ncbi:hypothetical protein [Paenibacillus thiaminolyticus]|uniref:hypothetical protein n=1 Tax=Paenibacillus thiaminolyticus TaxID=49283 RepID=UPI002542BB1B|nr:hypothetical protein [Paenibacillus thiaminolyticus]WII38558.1 hypothetical protein O0V01_05360 [Paenibacillus thiaminolyticus]
MMTYDFSSADGRTGTGTSRIFICSREKTAAKHSIDQVIMMHSEHEIASKKLLLGIPACSYG